MSRDNWTARETISFEIFLKLMDRYREDGYSDESAMGEAYRLADLLMKHAKED
jgi:hypothetical protein